MNQNENYYYISFNEWMDEWSFVEDVEGNNKKINRLKSNDFIRPGISGRDFVIDLMH